MPKFMTLRTDKVASVVQRILGEQMQLLELPFLTTISKVEISPDMKYGKIWITVMPAGEANESKILKLLDESIYDLQGSLNRGLPTKIVPRVKFAIDHSEEFSSHINELLRKTHDQE